MNFVGLIAHGLGAMSVFSDAILIRVSLASGLLLLLSLFGAAVVAAIKFHTSLAIPGWASNMYGFFLLATLQSAALPLVMAFMLLNTRSTVQLPPRHFVDSFISSIVTLHKGNYREVERPVVRL